MGAAGDSAGGPSGDGVTTGWRAHYWIGKQCTADKAGSAAALVVQLSSLASASDGMAVRQVREVEGAESTALLTAFPHLQAVPGGSASGWKARRLIQPPIRMIKVGLASSANIDGGRSGGGGCSVGKGVSLRCLKRVHRGRLLLSRLLQSGGKFSGSGERA